MKHFKLRVVCLLIFTLCSIAGLNAASQRPKMVVLIVIDGFRFDYLTRFDQYLSQGGLKLLLERGIERIVLAGASMGSLSVGRYFSVRQPQAVVAIAHLMPTADCPDWFRRAAGEAAYELATEQARVAIAEGRGDDDLLDIDIRQPAPSSVGARFRWTQRAASWLSWWGPDADSHNIVHIANADVPLLLLAGTDDSYNDAARFTALKAAAKNAPSIDEIWYPDIDHGLVGVEEQVAGDVHAWLVKVGVIPAV